MRYVVTCTDNNVAVDREWIGMFMVLGGEEYPPGVKPCTAEEIIKRCPHMRGQLHVWLLEEDDGKALVIGMEYSANERCKITELDAGLFDNIFETFAAYVRMLVNT